LEEPPKYIVKDRLYETPFRLIFNEGTDDKHHSLHLLGSKEVWDETSIKYWSN
jgi:hypothetical protein